MRGKEKIQFVCQECGYGSSRWMGRCPRCNSWNSMVEEETRTVEERREFRFSETPPLPIDKLTSFKEDRDRSGFKEFDRLLGGGIVPGSFTLLAGPPGIGKSTFLLQLADHLASPGNGCLYVSGEESSSQLKLRADRLGIKGEGLLIFSQTNMDEIMNQVKKIRPRFLIIDSIQAVYLPSLSGPPGSVGQVRECAGELLNLAKSGKISVFISGQITKEGSIAGPKILEHIVDTVLYFEATPDRMHRILSVEKNRFGATNEINLFSMRGDGLHQVLNPSELFLSQRDSSPGSVVAVPIEGTRPLLVELQALVCQASSPVPRRQGTGLDYGRILLLLAVIESRLRMPLYKYDVFFNVAGGLKVEEPAMDLGLIMAVYSSYKKIPIDNKAVVFGEVGLTGEVRTVPFIEKRMEEAERLGFKQVLLPRKNLDEFRNYKGNLKVFGVKDISEAIDFVKRK